MLYLFAVLQLLTAAGLLIKALRDAKREDGE